jgi:hypothetical protein
MTNTEYTSPQALVTGEHCSEQAPDAKQPSRAQKRREAKAQEEAEREARIAAEQAGMGDSDRLLEERALADLLRPLGLAVHDIPVRVFLTSPDLLLASRLFVCLLAVVRCLSTPIHSCSPQNPGLVKL